MAQGLLGYIDKGINKAGPALANAVRSYGGPGSEFMNNWLVAKGNQGPTREELAAQAAQQQQAQMQAAALAGQLSPEVVGQQMLSGNLQIPAMAGAMTPPDQQLLRDNAIPRYREQQKTYNDQMQAARAGVLSLIQSGQATKDILVQALQSGIISESDIPTAQVNQ